MSPWPNRGILTIRILQLVQVFVLCLQPSGGGGDYSAMESMLQQEKKLRTEAEQRLNTIKSSIDKTKTEEEALKSDIMDYERKIAKANLEIDKVACY